MNTTTIELEDAQLNRIVIEELKLQYSAIYTGVISMRRAAETVGLPPHRQEDLEYDLALMDAMRRVLRYYMTEPKYDAWISQFEEDNQHTDDMPVVAVTDVTEHDDGSATFSFTVSPGALTAFAEIGLRDALTKAAKQGCQNDTDDVDPDA